MLHSRLASPKIDPATRSLAVSSISRSKSTLTFGQVIPKMEDAYQKMGSKAVQSISRVQSAIKRKQDQMSLSTLPKVSSHKGKLFLGKLAKPGLILSAQARNNPWAEPNSINQMLINKKGLMEMINMGVLPKNANFTELLNHRYEEQKNKAQISPEMNAELENNFFPTNPNIMQENTQKIQIKQYKKQVTVESSEALGEKKVRKKLKKGQKSKKQQFMLEFPEEPVILVISNQQIEKTDAYYEQLKKVRKNGQEVVFKQYIKKVEQFAVKYGLKKFQFKVILDETRKMSDTVIKQHILNAKALGIHLAMKGSVSKRIKQVVLMFATRFKFKKSARDLLKIENIKRYFKIKKYYEQMTKKRCDFIRFKLGSFAERQRRFIEEANQRFPVHIHILGTVTENYDNQRSYYKIEHRNNIELTRLFSQQPQYLILLMEQQACDLSSWLALLAKVRGYRPTIQPIFSSLRNSKIKTYDSIYYGLNPTIMQKLQQITRKKDDVCVFPSGFCISLVKICEAFNAKLYSSSFWKPHLTRLLEEEDENQDLKAYQSFKNQSSAQHKRQVSSGVNLSSRSSPQTVSIELIRSRVSFNSNQHSKAQVKHFIQKIKTKQLNSYELNSQHYSNKLTMKNEILVGNQCSTPRSISFPARTDEKQFLQKLTETILSLKAVNRWVFKIGTTARFSRSLAFLETDSLKILKEKKKKLELTAADITEVTNIMKVILIDKLEIPQNSLFDSIQYLESFLNSGGYVESVIEEVSSECVFGKISVAGSFQILGTYTKIYTDQVVGCAATYPSQSITGKHVQQIRQLAEKMYRNHEILGHVTFQLLVEKKSQKCHFVDLVLNIQQYSSLYFMYTAIFNNLRQGQQSLNVLRKINQKKITINSKGQVKKPHKQQENFRVNSNQSKVSDIEKDKIQLIRQIVYVPFIDNNGNIYESFSQFEDACSLKSLKLLDFDEVQGLQFLYLNLREQKPDIMSLVAFSENQKKCLKYALDGLTFLTESGEQTNKFDKKVERRKYDCLYIHDVIWRLREIKKSKDSTVQIN